MVQTILDIAECAKDDMDRYHREVQYYDHEYNDLTHALELTRFNASEGYKLAKQMQENREKRRTSKDCIAQLSPLCNVIKKHHHFFNELKSVEREVQSVIRTQNVRTYRPRVRDDLFKMAEG